MIFLERTREDRSQSDELLELFHRQSDKLLEGNVGENFERRGGTHMGFSERTDTHLELD